MLLHFVLKKFIQQHRGANLQHNKYVGQLSTIMRALTSKDRDLLSHSDKTDETEFRINNSSLKHMLLNNNEEASRGKNKGKQKLEHIFSFSKTFKNITKNLGFHLTFKTANIQGIFS